LPREAKPPIPVRFTDTGDIAAPDHDGSQPEARDAALGRVEVVKKLVSAGSEVD